MVGILVGLVLEFIVDRIYDQKNEETNLFVVTPFLLYYLCDNQYF
jgi:NhaP-type Na+/H+ or K+/H+ antiporter